MGTNIYSYAYDAIGNRKTTDHGLQTTTYLANELNQYTNILEGAVSSAPEYDADGNMISCGAWTFGWDAENRLVIASNTETVIENRYDYMSRRVRKTVNGASLEFFYDGWAMIREVAGTETNDYVYGLDLSGTMQGAGTIGGILARVGVSGIAFYAYDANGNVTDMVDTNGSVVAHYEYDPYGNVLASSGSLASENHYRFSTKYTDNETGLVYYGFRFYSPTLGSWFSRDSIGERGGRNLYNFVRNAPIARFDKFGLIEAGECKCGVNETMKDPEIDSLIKSLQSRDVKGYPGFKCLVGTPWCNTCAGDSVGGMYTRKGSLGMEIQICYGTSRGTDDAKVTLLHELQHAAEYCDKPGGDCGDLVCSEARAYFCSGTCNTPEECASHAADSSEGHSRCPGKSWDELKEMAKSCKLDKADCKVPRPTP